MPPQAKILLSKNSADPTDGPIEVALGDTIQPIAESMAYWTDPPAVWRIKAWPEGWPGPGAGWTLNDSSNAWEFIGNETPPEIAITSTVGLFGKWILDLVVMGGVLDGVPDDSLTDSVGWKLPSATLGLTGIALWENDHFDENRLWPGEVASNLKKVETFAAGLGPVDFAAVKAALAVADSAISVNSQKITNLASPSASTDADTKGARDTAISTATAALVSSVSGTAPIVSSGGTTPAISISPASGVAAGSMSSSDFNKLSGIESGAQVTSFARVNTALSGANADISVNSQKITNLASPSASTDADTKGARDTAISAAVGSLVSSVTGTAPIVSSGGTTPAISISAASGSNAGSMSTAHYTLVNGATSAATNSALMQRDGSGRAKVADPSANDDIDTKGARDTAIAAIAQYFPLHWAFASGITGSNPAVLHWVPQGPRMLDNTSTTPTNGFRQPLHVNCQLMGFFLAAVQGGIPTSGTLTFTVWKNGVATSDTFELNNNTTGNSAITTITGGGAFTTTYTAGTDDIALKVNVKTGSNIAIAASNWCFVAKMKVV